MADPETRTTAEPDYDRLLRANLDRVFNERDADKRATALAELFVDEPVMYEPTEVVHGRHAISTVAGKLLDQFGPTFRFTPVGRAVGDHGLGSLTWQAVPPSGPVAVTDRERQVRVFGPLSLERVEAVGLRLDVDAAPPALVERPGHGVVGRIECADINIEAGWPAPQRSPEDDVLSVLGV